MHFKTFVCTAFVLSVWYFEVNFALGYVSTIVAASAAAFTKYIIYTLYAY